MKPLSDAISLSRACFCALLCCAVAEMVGARSVRAADVEDVVVIANGKVPESLELARYYMKARGIAEERLCALDLPTGEDISRGAYENRLRDPLLAYLREHELAEQVRREKSNVKEHESGWTTVKSAVRYFVCMYGVPLRIDDTKPELLEKLENRLSLGYSRDAASVDSELCLVLHDTYDLRGRFPNPFYNQLHWDSSEQNGYHFVMVGRLDGPSPDVVRRMIDDAIRAETYGLHGRAYFDLRAPHDDDYRTGDYWLEEAAERFRREGYECTVDRNDFVMGELYPIDDAAIYLGWYTEKVAGPFLRPDFHFRPGAIAYHNHSANAKSLRTSTDYWAGPLLAKGAAVTMGAVAEPYLLFTPNLQIFADRICQGYTFAESVYLSLSVLSWQSVCVGDPLYRPFALSLDDQIKKLEAGGRPEVEWAYLRKINLLAREGRLNIALNYCREKLRGKESRVLREKLADLYAMNELYDDAALQYERALRETERAETAMRIGTRYLLMLRLLGKSDKANEMEAELKKRWKDSPFLALLDQARP